MTLKSDQLELIIDIVRSCRGGFIHRNGSGAMEVWMNHQAKFSDFIAAKILKPIAMRE
jgi:hypothetical protein